MVDWFNSRQLLEAIGYMPAEEHAARYYSQTPRHALTNSLSQEPGAVHVAF